MSIKTSVKLAECRKACGACCIAPSISSPIPGMPNGKPANTVCVNLNSDYQCEIFGSTERPLVCAELLPEREMCGENRDQAIEILSLLERLTSSRF